MDFIAFSDGMVATIVVLSFFLSRLRLRYVRTGRVVPLLMAGGFRDRHMRLIMPTESSAGGAKNKHRRQQVDDLEKIIVHIILL
jgi:hypothetical protein